MSVDAFRMKWFQMIDHFIEMSWCDQWDVSTSIDGLELQDKMHGHGLRKKEVKL